MSMDQRRAVIRKIDQIEMELRGLETRLTSLRYMLAEEFGVKPEPKDEPQVSARFR